MCEADLDHVTTELSKNVKVHHETSGVDHSVNPEILELIANITLRIGFIRHIDTVQKNDHRRD